MGFLKKFGQVALQVLQIATGVAPIVRQSFPDGTKGAKALDTLGEVAEIIGTVEVIGQALAIPGPQKLTAATPLVAQAIIQSSLVAGHEIGDPALFAEGCQDIANGTVKILNSRKPKVVSIAPQDL